MPDDDGDGPSKKNGQPPEDRLNDDRAERRRGKIANPSPPLRAPSPNEENQRQDPYRAGDHPVAMFRAYVFRLEPPLRHDLPVREGPIGHGKTRPLARHESAREHQSERADGDDDREAVKPRRRNEGSAVRIQSGWPSGRVVSMKARRKTQGSPNLPPRNVISQE